MSKNIVFILKVDIKHTFIPNFGMPWFFIFTAALRSAVFLYLYTQFYNDFKLQK